MSRYIHGMHAGSVRDGYGSTGAALMEHKPGWITFTEIAGIDGGDYSRYKAAGFGVLVRLNHGYHPHGTIPERASYPDFAATCAMHVKASQGVDAWTISNEPNHSQERPHGVTIWANDYADCFRMCRDAIRAETPAAQVLVAGVAPYNAETGDFRSYFGAVLHNLDGGYDGVCIHAYTHGADPALITSEATMGPPLTGAHYHFRVYRDLMHYVPDGVPVYITETDQNDPWTNENRGWVREMYREVNAWNEDHPQRVIRCACLYRYPAFDQWAIVDKPAVIEDFQQAVDIGYTWTDTEPEPPEPEPPEPEPPEEEPVTTIYDGFENGFYAFGGEGELTCPNGWVPVWEDDPQDGVLDRPEYKPAGAAQIRNGTGAVAIHSRYQTINGALVRSVNANPGEAVSASVWTMKEATEGGSATRIGIDPSGGTLLTASTVQWGDWYSQYSPDWAAGEWRQRDVSVTAESNIVTVFLQSKADTAVDGTHAHFDDVEVTVAGDVPQPPDPDPDPDPDPIGGDVIRVRLLINDDTVFDQSYEAQVTSLVLKPVGGVVASLMRLLGR